MTSTPRQRPPPPPQRAWAHLRAVAVLTCRSWSLDKASMWSAALAFYSMLSLGPLLYAAAALGGLCLGAEVAQQAIVDQVGDTVGPQAAAAAREMMAAAWQHHDGLWASLLAAATLLFGASGVFSALQDAVDAIWHVAPRPAAGLLAWLRRRFVSMAMVVGVGFLSAVSFVVSAALAIVHGRLAQGLPLGAVLALALETAATTGCFTLFFAAMFKVLPDAKLRWREVWAGGAVTAGMFSAGKVLLAIYLRQARPDSPFGAASSLALMLIWVYYAAQIFFLGAEWVRADVQCRGRPIQPTANAVAVRTVQVDPAQTKRRRPRRRRPANHPHPSPPGPPLGRP